MSELLPCPFCGALEGDGKKDVDPAGWLARDSLGNKTRGPQCLNCGATALSTEDWNKRVTMTYGQAKKAIELFEHEMIGQDVRVLWHWALVEALKER